MWANRLGGVKDLARATQGPQGHLDGLRVSWAGECSAGPYLGPRQCLGLPKPGPLLASRGDGPTSCPFLLDVSFPKPPHPVPQLVPLAPPSDSIPSLAAHLLHLAGHQRFLPRPFHSLPMGLPASTTPLPSAERPFQCPSQQHLPGALHLHRIKCKLLPVGSQSRHGVAVSPASNHTPPAHSLLRALALLFPLPELCSLHLCTTRFSCGSGLNFCILVYLLLWLCGS